MELYFKAEQTDLIEIKTGDIVFLESLRESVIPPYLMLLPFCELPDILEEVEINALEEDGVHGAVFVLKPLKPGTGTISIGFRDLQTQKITHQKEIAVVIQP